MISLKKHYSDKVLPELKQAMGLTSDMGVPKITKVTINMGVGEVLTDKKVLENAAEDLAIPSRNAALAANSKHITFESTSWKSPSVSVAL